ncbi:hypothetical protein D0864_10446 [Hortaea werneckii]|uniref:SH3 domain-containing protein n=1 Tax=Hortaea werneckii TaxID=91943 RepID=A0A3M7E812_HORWE|nr:hypothetical protein D0864_10446 [Hortaea werneckii]
MAPLEEMHTANVNRSIRTIKAASHHPQPARQYLCDASIISPQQLSDLLQRMPEQTALHAPISVGAIPQGTPGALQPPTSPLHNLNLQNGNRNRMNGQANNEKKDNPYFQAAASPQPPPPAYNAPPPQANWSQPPLAQATALYAYNSTDEGDLALQPHDHITVTEYMNAEWWKGKSSRTGMEGIFPRSYVKVIDEKAPMASTSNNYGNAPLEVSQMGNGEGKVPGKGEEMGKKFGKKLGNAAIFGAGATIGGNIVNGIF